jgi:hypothetical protein
MRTRSSSAPSGGNPDGPQSRSRHPPAPHPPTHPRPARRLARQRPARARQRRLDEPRADDVRPGRRSGDDGYVEHAPLDEAGAQFLETLQAGADRFEGQDISADREITEGAAAEASTSGPSREEIDRIRAMRKPLGAMSQKLALPARRGYHRHWFNDTAGRIEEAQAAGWSFVKGNDGKNIKRCVGTGRDKNALWAYAMELPLVFWQEDQDHKNAAAAAVMDGLKNQAFTAAPGSMSRADNGKFYDPTETGSPIKTGVHR